MCSHLEVGTPGLCVRGRVGGSELMRSLVEAHGEPWGDSGLGG